MIKPIDCKTIEDVCKLETDYLEVNDYCITLDGYSVILNEQPSGESAKQEIRMPKAVFDNLIKWYQKPQKKQEGK